MAKKLIYSTDADKMGYSFKEYQEQQRELDNPVPEKEDSDFWEWRSEMHQMDFDDFMSNVKYCEYNTRCYVTGSVGFWYGRRELARNDFDTLIEAIHKCINDQDDFDIFTDGNAVYVDSYNHDSRFHGGNHFKIVICGKKIKGGYLF